MILTRSPLRVTFGGGGTVLPSYASVHGGFTLSAAITKYVYVAVVNPFTPGIYLKTNVVENVTNLSDLTHPLIKKCLEVTKVDRVAITTFADVPAGTGLGSSSALTTALLKALHVYTGRDISTEDLAALACKVDNIGGKQDQYTAAYGGVNSFIFTEGTFHYNLDVPQALREHLFLFYTNLSRTTPAQPLNPDTSLLHKVKALGVASAHALRYEDLNTFASLLTEQWELKLQWNPQGVPQAIRDFHSAGLQAGALGGKLIGGGGGGFLMFYTMDPEALRATMSRLGLIEMPFDFDFEGTKVVSR